MASSQAHGGANSASLANIEAYGGRLCWREKPGSESIALESSCEFPAKEGNHNLIRNVGNIVIDEQGIHIVQYGKYHTSVVQRLHEPKWQVDFNHDSFRNVRLANPDPTKIEITLQGTFVPPHAYDATVKKMASFSQDRKQESHPATFPLAVLTPDTINTQDREYQISFKRPSSFNWPSLLHLLAAKIPLVTQLDDELMKFLCPMSLQTYIAATSMSPGVVTFRRYGATGEGKWLLEPTE